VLLGKYRHAIDSKNRLIIPAKIKDQLGPVITVLKNTDKCLTLYSAEEWARYTEKISALPPTKSRALVRYLFSNAFELQPDAQGRVILPQDILDYAMIQKNIITVGCGNYAEIWAEERWMEMQLDEEPDGYENDLTEMGL